MGRALAVGAFLVLASLLFAPHAQAQCVGCDVVLDGDTMRPISITCDIAGDGSFCDINLNLSAGTWSCTPIGACGGGTSECFGDYDDPPECWDDQELY